MNEGNGTALRCVEMKTQHGPGPVGQLSRYSFVKAFKWSSTSASSGGDCTMAPGLRQGAAVALRLRLQQQQPYASKFLSSAAMGGRPALGAAASEQGGKVRKGLCSVCMHACCVGSVCVRLRAQACQSPPHRPCSPSGMRCSPIHAHTRRQPLRT